MAKRPLVSSAIRTEFGDVLDDPSFYDAGAADRDQTYVPGFSDLRRARDLEIADVASGRKPAHEAKIDALPVNLRWVRNSTPRDGAPDTRKQTASGNLGYTLVSKDAIGKEAWLTKLPPGARITADGAIQKGDTVLMVADAKTAARNAARKAAQTRRQTNDAAAAAGGLLDVSTKRPGAEAYIKKEA